MPQEATGWVEVSALLGQGSEFSGTLVFEGRARIDGTFRGKVSTPDVLILGATSEVFAEVHCGTLIVRGGTLHGNVRATELVEVYAPGRIDGDIEAPKVFIEKGARLDGRCTMAESPKDEGR